MPTPSARANTPTGAAHSTQRTMVIMIWPMLSKKSFTALRRSSGSRVVAKPKKAANTTSGRMAFSDAAFRAFSGARPETKPTKVGAALATSGAAVAPARKAAAAAPVTGQTA